MFVFTTWLSSTPTCFPQNAWISMDCIMIAFKLQLLTRWDICSTVHKFQAGVGKCCTARMLKKHKEKLRVCCFFPPSNCKRNTQKIQYLVWLPFVYTASLLLGTLHTVFDLCKEDFPNIIENQPKIVLSIWVGSNLSVSARDPIQTPSC